MSKTFVLVHGAFAGAYAWDKVKPLLEAAGNRVVAFDLPAHGDDEAAPKDATFESYVERVRNFINAESEKVILVGHSMGGVVVSQAAENLPDKIEKLVYLSAYLPKNGESLQDLAEGDADSLIGRNLQFAADYSTGTLPAEIAVEVFAGDCSDDCQAIDRRQIETRTARSVSGETLALRRKFRQSSEIFYRNDARQRRWDCFAGKNDRGKRGGQTGFQNRIGTQPVFCETRRVGGDLERFIKGEDDANSDIFLDFWSGDF